MNIISQEIDNSWKKVYEHRKEYVDDLATLISQSSDVDHETAILVIANFYREGFVDAIKQLHKRGVKWS